MLRDLGQLLLRVLQNVMDKENSHQIDCQTSGAAAVALVFGMSMSCLKAAACSWAAAAHLQCQGRVQRDQVDRDRD